MTCRVIVTVILAILQTALWALLAAAALHLLRAGLRALAPIAPRLDPLPPDGELPLVTVQLPLRNEVGVAERVLRAACALDWPRLEVQVLDDSDDETRAVVDRAAAELRAEGAAITVVRREGRRGFKAGALQNALPAARGDILLVLDADSQPPPDLLRRLVPPLLADPVLAFTQARWSFENEDASLLTRVQALILDGLMLVEQPLLSAAGRPVQFNGTAGAWRRDALLAAGGWTGPPDNNGGGASITEDLDLSYRARLAGYRGLHMGDVAVETELPETMAAFRAQQRRWIGGGGQVLRALLGRLVRGGLPLGDRLGMLAHLARHARQPLLLLAALWLPAVELGFARPAFAPRGVWPVVVGALWIALTVYYGAARARRGRGVLAAALLAPAVMALSMGLSLVATAAFLRGLLERPGRAEFVRTPKAGRYRAALDPLAAVEAAIGCAHAAAALLLATHGQTLAAAGLALVAWGFLWVGASSLQGTLKR